MAAKTTVTTLPNGLRLIFDPVENRRTCAIRLLVRSGVGYESPVQLGISHLIEHMVFRGTETRTSLEIARQSDEIGGSLNAYTARDHTCFYAHTLRENAPKALTLICDMLTHPRFDPADLETEKGVVREEIAMYEDSPEELCADLFFAHAWAGSTFGGNVLGTRETLAAMDRTALLDHMARFYTPERTVISFSGSFDPAEMTAICEAYFGDRPRGSLPLAHPSAQFVPFVLAQEKESAQNQLIIGFDGVPFDDLQRYHAAGILSLLLAGTSSSRLYQRLRDTLGLVYSVDSCNFGFHGCGLFTISMGLSAASEPKAIAETLRALRALPQTLTDSEFAIARAHALTGFIMNGESLTARAAYHAETLLDCGRLMPREEELAVLQAVTPETVRAAAEHIFAFDRISLCAVGQVQSAAEYRAWLKRT